MVARFRGEAPGWAAHVAPGFLETSQEHCVDHVRAFLTVARERRTLSEDELGFVRAQARLRARQGVALEDMQQVHGIGSRAIFHALVQTAATRPGGAAAALVLVDQLVAHGVMVTTTFTEAYLAERRNMGDDGS